MSAMKVLIVNSGCSDCGLVKPTRSRPKHIHPALRNGRHIL